MDFLKKTKFWKSILIVVLFLLNIFCVYVLLGEDRRGILTVSFLNIGQGDAIFIDAPNGNQLLLDGGAGRAVLRELSKSMPFYDRSIDVVLASHADQDHVGGLPDVLNKYNVPVFLENGLAGKSSSYDELERIVKDRVSKDKIKQIILRAGMVVDLGSGVELRILFPDRNPKGMDTNDSSVVAKLVYGETEFLLTGDSPKSIEEYLVNKKVDLKSDVLKAGHHGSKTSSSNIFVKAVDPSYVVISAGKDNKYGHPHREVLEVFKNNNVVIKNTALEGRIVFESDGVNLKIK